jgi:hypothetical protein
VDCLGPVEAGDAAAFDGDDVLRLRFRIVSGTGKEGLWGAIGRSLV